LSSVPISTAHSIEAIIAISDNIHIVLGVLSAMPASQSIGPKYLPFDCSSAFIASRGAAVKHPTVSKFTK
jgi:hypothetical protein